MPKVSIDDPIFEKKDFNKIKEWVDSIHLKNQMGIICSLAIDINDIHISFSWEDGHMHYDKIALTRNLDSERWTKPYYAMMTYHELCTRVRSKTNNL